MVRVKTDLTEGELWAREELGALLAARFSPPAVARFLVHSQVRTNAQRVERADTARRMRAWVTVGAGAYLALAASGDPVARRALKSSLRWWAATWVMLDWHIAMFETEDGRPRNLGPADAVTLARCWMVPLAADTPTPLLCLSAWASDGLDGRLARAGEPTRAGRDLEGLVDTCFAAAALSGAVKQGWIGRPAAACELLRLGAGFAYALWIYFGTADAPDPAVTKAARQTTPVRVAGLVAAGLRRRRLADALVVGGSAWSMAVVVRSLRRGASTDA